jgi:hypothetical protein
LVGRRENVGRIDDTGGGLDGVFGLRGCGGYGEDVVLGLMWMLGLAGGRVGVDVGRSVVRMLLLGLGCLKLLQGRVVGQPES